jgi:hypothetical protein
VTPTSLSADTATPAATAVPIDTVDPPPGTIELTTAVVKFDRDGTPSVLTEGEEMASCVGPVEDCFPVCGMYFRPTRQHLFMPSNRTRRAKSIPCSPTRSIVSKITRCQLTQQYGFPKNSIIGFTSTTM